MEQEYRRLDTITRRKFLGRLGVLPLGVIAWQTVGCGESPTGEENSPIVIEPSTLTPSPTSELRLQTPTIVPTAVATKDLAPTDTKGVETATPTSIATPDFSRKDGSANVVEITPTPRPIVAQPEITPVLRPTVVAPEITPIPTPVATPTPELVGPYTSGLDPRVRSYVESQGWFKDGVDAREANLLGFMQDAAKNRGLDSRLPLITIPGTLSPIRFQLFEPERQIETIEKKSYDYVSLTGKEILVVVSSNRGQLNLSEVRAAIVAAKAWLPKVDEFMGGMYPYRYLHLGLIDLSTSTARDSNIFLMSSSESNPRRITHEFVHTYSRPGAHPTWFEEGIANVISYHVARGNFLDSYAVFANGAKINLEMKVGSGPFNQYGIESGNGTVFLKEVYDLISPNNMSLAVRQIFPGSKMGAQILEILASNTPADKKEALGAIYKKWVG